MKQIALRWGNRSFEALVLTAVAWSTLALGGAWGWGIAITFGLLAAAFCVWAGMRILVDRSFQPRADGQNARTTEGDKDAESPDERENESLGSESAPPLRVRSQAACAFMIVFGVFLILQVTPLPVGLLQLVAPARVARERQLWEALGGPSPKTLTLAVDSNTSRRALALVALAVMAFTAGAYLATGRTRIRRTMRILVVLALFEALYGLAEHLSGHYHIFWIPVGGDFARGTFFNRNHFAATLALFLPVMIGWFYFRAAAAKSRHEHSHILPATTWDILGSKQGLWLLPPAVLVVGIIQSQSRGGFSSMLLAAALMFAIGARSKSVRAISWLTLPLALALFAYGVNSDYQAVLDRFGNLTRNVNAEGRTTIWKDSLGIVRAFPLFGVGLGNFPRVYMQYASVSTLDYPYMAHNEWLEGLITLGAIGMGLAVVAMGGFFVKTFIRIRRAGPDSPWLLGCWCGLIGLAFHCFGEFNLHIPSIVVTASLMAGILLGFNMAHHLRGKSGASNNRGRRREHPSSQLAVPKRANE